MNDALNCWLYLVHVCFKTLVCTKIIYTCIKCAQGKLLEKLEDNIWDFKPKLSFAGAYYFCSLNNTVFSTNMTVFIIPFSFVAYKVVNILPK